MNKPKFERQLPGIDIMALLLVVWLCSLPLIALIVIPLLGLRAGIAVAILLLIVMLLICWGRCIPMIVQEYRKQKRRYASNSLTDQPK